MNWLFAKQIDQRLLKAGGMVMCKYMDNSRTINWSQGNSAYLEFEGWGSGSNR